jgi:hypothetical protein
MVARRVGTFDITQLTLEAEVDHVVDVLGLELLGGGSQSTN